MRKFQVITITIAFLFAGVAQATLLDGLVAYYPFNGNANDESGNGNNGIVNGATLTMDRFGTASSAYSFDGVDDYVSVSDSPSLDLTTYRMTIASWFRTSNPTPNQDKGLVEKGDIWALTLRSDGKVNIGMYFGPTYPNDYYSAISTTIVSPDTWYHVAGSYDGSAMRIFVNGVLESSTPITGNFNTDDRRLCIGSNVWGSDQPTIFTNASIDEVRIYNRALSDSEIMALAPEPATIALLGLGSLMIRRRKK